MKSQVSIYAANATPGNYSRYQGRRGSLSLLGCTILAIMQVETKATETLHGDRVRIFAAISLHCVLYARLFRFE